MKTEAINYTATSYIPAVVFSIFVPGRSTRLRICHLISPFFLYALRLRLGSTVAFDLVSAHIPYLTSTDISIDFSHGNSSLPLRHI